MRISDWSSDVCSADLFAELHTAGFAVPHWPAEWGGGMSVAEQIVLYSELAAHDAPRLVLAFVGIHHAASPLLAAGTERAEERRAGKECVSTCRSRWSPVLSKQQIHKQNNQRA